MSEFLRRKLVSALSSDAFTQWYDHEIRGFSENANPYEIADMVWSEVRDRVESILNDHVPRPVSKNAATDRQLGYLGKLGYTGDLPETKRDASDLISKIKAEKDAKEKREATEAVISLDADSDNHTMLLYHIWEHPL